MMKAMTAEQMRSDAVKHPIAPLLTLTPVTWASLLATLLVLAPWVPLFTL